MSQRHPNYPDLGRLGRPYLLLLTGCGESATQIHATDVVAVLFDLRDTGWQAIQVMRPPVNVVGFPTLFLSGDRLWFGVNGQNDAYTWDGNEFRR